jgi:hypothetical protein
MAAVYLDYYPSSMYGFRHHGGRAEAVEQYLPSLLILKWKYDFPVPLHIHHRPLVVGREIQGDVKMTEMRLAVVGIFAFSISIMDDHAEPDTVG